MIKRKIDRHLQDFFLNDKKALLLTGARLIGKTFSIRQFGHEHFRTAPAVNVKENATAYTMEVAAPGLKKDMVKMNIDKDGYLNVSIEQKADKKDEKKEEHYLRREFSYSSYSQSYALPEDADAEKISAEVSDGVLKIEIPKVAKEEKKEDVKQIEVK